ncbi:I78 family peptidase inhibitor [Luteimonas huabeiensis]|uniref:I78 family peptidase inhibitor n=1 Tax=Luteimonas huabeiensis TaxID=1244513 RepID=UPI000464C77A|nr:I78 family peptidase inhibitor [Luteimonas huabeiensis]
MRIATAHTVPVLGLAVLVLAACAPATRDSGAGDGTTALPPVAGACDAGRVQSFVGQAASDDVVERARVGAGASVARTLKPGQAVTLEYMEGRLNLYLDEAGTIAELRCG